MCLVNTHFDQSLHCSLKKTGIAGYPDRVARTMMSMRLPECVGLAGALLDVHVQKYVFLPCGSCEHFGMYQQNHLIFIEFAQNMETL